MALTSSRITQSYQHEQSTPASSWVVNHGLQGYPLVDVYVDISGSLKKIIPAAIVYVDENTCQINFSAAVSGYATVV